MRCVAVIGTDDVPETHWPLFERLADLVTDAGFRLRYHHGPAGDLFSRFFRGRITCGFWHEFDETGRRVWVNPNAGNLRPVMIRQVREYMKMPVEDKYVAMATMACLYALEGPGVVDADLVLTFHQDESKNKVPLFLASNLGFKVYNIADRKQLSEVATFLKS